VVLESPVTQCELAIVESWRRSHKSVADYDAARTACGALSKRAFQYDDMMSCLCQRERTRQSCNAGANYGVLGTGRKRRETRRCGHSPRAGVKKCPRDGTDFSHVVFGTPIQRSIKITEGNRMKLLAKSLLQPSHSPWTEDTVDRNPFGSIESAQEYLRLLAEAVQEAQLTFPEDVADSEPIDEQSRARRLQAMQLVSYKLNQLAVHVNGSRCALNDLRTLRRLLLRERALGMKSVKSPKS
jgi:hypothetical protein